MDSVSSFRQPSQARDAAAGAPAVEAVGLAATPEQRVAAFAEHHARRLRVPEDAGRWLAEAAALRTRCTELLLRGHPQGVLDAAPAVVWGETLQPAPEYRIRKLRYEGYPGVWVPALLYEPDETATGATASGGAGLPAVLNAHGHHPGGIAADFKQARCINVAKRGMVTLSFEFLGMGETASLKAHNQQLLMDLAGVCGAGVFLVAMKRALDLLLGHPAVDPARVAMTGLSGGGWQTVLLGALDERIRVAVPVAGHMPAWARRDHGDVGDAEQLPADLCTVADYDTLSALLAPRPTLFIFNRFDDCCFQPHKAVAGTYEAARAAFELLGAGEHCALHVNEDPGHNYGADNRSRLYRWLDRHFGLLTPAGDLPWRREVLSERDLAVGLPPERPSFAALAGAALHRLRRREAAAHDGAGPARTVDRGAVRGVLRYRAGAVTAATVATSWAAPGGLLTEELLLEVDRRWPLPATLVRNDAARAATLLLGHGGRPRPADLTTRAGATGRTLLAVDLLGCGSLRFAARYGLLLAAVGHPLLGLQVAQLLAVAHWLRLDTGGLPLTVEAGSPALGVAALLAAALEPDALATVDALNLSRSLDELIELAVPYGGDAYGGDAYGGDAAALFCFGLRATLDLDDLPPLAPRVSVHAPRRGPLVSTADLSNGAGAAMDARAANG